MRGFISFVIGAFSGALGKVAATALLVAMGFTPEQLLQLFVDPPWWLTHWAIRLVFVICAILMLAWIFYDQSRIEIQIPDKLKRLDEVTFKIVAETLAGVESLGLTKDEIFHALLKALWLGDFESSSGKSRVAIPIRDGVRMINNQPMPLSKRKDANDIDRDVDFSPEKLYFTRRMLLSINMGIHHIYPTLSKLIKSINDDSIEWKSIKLSIKFDLIASIEPRFYDEHYRSAYLEELLVKRDDLVYWFKRLRAGKYKV